MADISLIKILQEIGDLSNTPFKYSSNFIELSFDIKQNLFKDDEGNQIEISFQPVSKVPDTDEWVYNVGFKVNSVEKTIALPDKDNKYYLKLMHTLSKIILEFIKKYNPGALSIKGVDDDQDRSEQKNNIYFEYVKKLIPNPYRWTQLPENILYIYKPNQIQQKQIQMSKDLYEWIKNK